jgi:hypothetical protein
MTEDSRNTHEPGDGELKEALRSAITPPLGAVDWERLHERIMTDARRRATPTPMRASEWVAAWSRRGIPAVASALAAAIAALLILPIERRAAVPQPPGFWPVAEELVSSLPEETRRMLLAGDDVDSLLGAVMADGREERDRS